MISSGPANESQPSTGIGSDAVQKPSRAVMQRQGVVHPHGSLPIDPARSSGPPYLAGSAATKSSPTT